MPLTSTINPKNIRYVGFWLRTMAAIIDTFCLSLLLIPILIFVFNDPLGHTSAGMAIQIILPAFAFIAFWKACSSSPGKLAIGAIIIDADTYQKPTNRQWLIRYLGYYLASIPFLIGIFWVGFDKKKQGWHDKLAHTIVVFKVNNLAESPEKID